MSHTSLVPGKTDGVAVPAGYIGEQRTDSGSATVIQAVTTNVAFNIGTLSLAPGIWNVFGSARFARPSGATGVSYVTLGTNDTSVTMPNAVFSGQIENGAGQVPQGDNTIISPLRRYLLASTTTIYLVGVHNFSTLSTAGFSYWYIQAIRIG